MDLIYDGPSVINGDPIIVAVTGIENASSNIKTGPMLQTWIIRSDMPPTEAVKSGQDEAVCGSCPLRKNVCYVNLSFRPNKIYKAYKEGKYEIRNPKLVGWNQRIRLGSYGDPAAVPIQIWHNLLQHANGWTGYTHSPLHSPDLKKYCQASVETVASAELYQNLGWKTYRIKTPEESVTRKEVMCPSEKGVTCFTCLKCNGTDANVVIDVHGLTHKINKFRQMETV